MWGVLFCLFVFVWFFACCFFVFVLFWEGVFVVAMFGGFSGFDYYSRVFNSDISATA